MTEKPETTRVAAGRMLGITVPAGTERFYAEVGDPAHGATERPGLTGEPTPEELEHLVQTAWKYGIEIMLPPSETETE
jgi:hypothetical protein